MATRNPSTNEQKLHAAVVAAAALLAVAMVAAAAWALTRPEPPGSTLRMSSDAWGGSKNATGTPSVPGLVPSGSAGYEPTGPVGVVTPAPSGVSTATQASSRRIAFHIGETLYISSEDAKTKTPMHVVGTNYALSPDGRAVAAVEKGKLMVANVGEHLLESSPHKPGLTAEAVPPVWTPDSSAVLFIRANKEGMARVWKLERSSGLVTEIGPGAGIAVSPDGRTIVSLPTEDLAVPVISVTRLAGGNSTFRISAGDPVAIAIGTERIFVSTVSTAGVSAIWSVTYDGTKQRKVVGTEAAGSTGVTYGELMLSPDGKKLLFAADGDDGYSRLWTVPVAGGTPTKISGRRDGYAIAWTRDGKGILFIEGNAFQGQATSLWLTDLTGNRRKMLLDGATL